MFKKGELVVYPAHGIGRIEDVQVKLVDGEERLFLVVRIIENEMKILLPVTNAKHVGVRPLIDRDEIPQIFEVLKKREISVVSASWNKRYREYKDKIKSGSIYELAEVFRNLYLIQTAKKPFFWREEDARNGKVAYGEGNFLGHRNFGSQVEEMIYQSMNDNDSK